MIEKIKKAIENFLQKIRIIFNKEATVIIEEEFWGGLLWIWESEKDYVFWAEIDLEKELKTRGIINRQVRYEYNQGAQYETRNWCTVYSAITEVSWLMNREFSLEEILEIGRGMIAKWKLNPDRGAFLHDAIDQVREWWNGNNPDALLESYRIYYSDTKLRNILTHVSPRLTQLWYRTSTELFQEVQLTWVASKKTYPKNGGHAVSQWGLNTINNYKGKMLQRGEYRNRFSFEHFDKLVVNWIIYKVGYLFLRKG